MHPTTATSRPVPRDRPDQVTHALDTITHHNDHHDGPALHCTEPLCRNAGELIRDIVAGRP